MIDDAFQNDEEEQEADEEVDKIFFEITNKQLSDVRAPQGQIRESKTVDVDEVGRFCVQFCRGAVFHFQLHCK
jgi:hypothetical protein